MRSLIASPSEITGLNVTIPHKEAALGRCDWVEPAAREIGAVNTLVVKKGRLLGYNTDGEGYLRSLRESGFRPAGKRIVILGAGGAARAIAHALARAGAARIVVANRTPGRARRLIRRFAKSARKISLQAVPLQKIRLAPFFPETDLLINATPVGLKGTCFHDLPLPLLPKMAIVSDLVYRPLLTPLLLAAKRRRLRVHTGLGMLLHQGALCFKLWTGRNPPLGVMRKALLDGIRKKQ